jgi:RHS repeat-associated protein
MALGYDAQGNLAFKNGSTYGFDDGNRLRSAAGQAYRYDAQGRRVRSDVGGAQRRYSLYAQDGRLLWQRDEVAGTRSVNVYLAGSLVAEYRRPLSGTVASVGFLHTDALGSPIARTDAAGAVIETSEYEPYGLLLNRANDDRAGYTGHVMDSATGLTYMQQRYYDPQIGKFLSVDPVTADTVTGWNFNRYNYAANNPYKFKDPDGRIIETAWDAANVAMGVASFAKNVAIGNYAGAAVDAVGVVIDAAATVTPVVPGGAGAAIKAARLAENVAQGAKAEKAAVRELGGNVAKQRVTLEASTGQRSVADIVTKDKRVVEMKSGGGRLSPGQRAVKADIDAGRPVTPRGRNAEQAGLEPGKPTQMKSYEEKRY